MKKVIKNKTPITIINDYINNNTIYVKEEAQNPSGSIKDRAFDFVLNHLKNQGILKPDMIVTLSSSGNAAISLLYFANKYRIKPILFLPKATTKERLNILENLNANYFIIEGKMEECNESAKKYAEENGGYFIDQFNDPLFLSSHMDTTQEIVRQIAKIDYMILTSGSGVTISALGSKIKKQYKGLKLIAYELKQSPFITSSSYSSHSIEGIGPNFKPQNLIDSYIDQVIQLNQNEILELSLTLIKRGFNYGLSTFGSFLTIEKLNLHDSHILIVSYDDASKYLSTLKEYEKRKRID